MYPSVASVLINYVPFPADVCVVDEPQVKAPFTHFDDILL